VSIDSGQTGFPFPSVFKLLTSKTLPQLSKSAIKAPKERNIKEKDEGNY
jgi:hypothetical protein